MKLFQIEEPDGSPTGEPEGPGAAVGIDLPGGQVAIAVGGNAELLHDRLGEEVLPANPVRDRLLALRGRAEKALARPVTHAVIAVAALGNEAALTEEAAAAGLTIIRIVAAPDAAAAAATAGPDAVAFGAAVLAEDGAPPPTLS